MKKMEIHFSKTVSQLFLDAGFAEFNHFIYKIIVFKVKHDL